MMSLLIDASVVWWQWMAAMSLQVTVFVILVAVLDRLLARWTWPELQLALWLVVIVKLIVPPTVTSPVSIARLWSGASAAHGFAGVALPGSSLVVIAFLVWAVGLLLLGALTARRYCRLRREWLHSRAERSPTWFPDLVRNGANQLGLARIPTVRIQRGVPGPAVVGFVRPVIVVPASLLEEATRIQVGHVLMHELAHIKRRDPLISLACLVVQLVYWFHPLVWLTRARLTTLREICCDQSVAILLGPATAEYRRTLLHLARSLLQRPIIGRLAFLPRPSQLLARLTWLERPAPRRLWLRRAETMPLFAVLLLCGVPLARPSSPAQIPQLVAPDIPPLGELQGCLQLRFAVYGLLAQEEQRDGQR